MTGAERFASARRERCIRSLAAFTRAAWHIVERTTPLIWNWHIDCVAEHLEALVRGYIRRLVIELPPGCMKSTTASVMFPAWIWASGMPGFRGIFASYDRDLCIRDSLRSRAIVTSSWYRENFSSQYRDESGELAPWDLSPDRNTTEIFANTLTGHREIAVVGGGGTGFRADGISVDDALSAEGARNRNERETAIRWYDETMSSRLSDVRTGWFLVMGQRLHRQDLSGHCLRARERGEAEYHELCLPSEYDPKRSKVVVGRDPRADVPANDESVPRGPVHGGVLLFPERFPAVELKEARLKLRAEGYAAQHDQDPVVEGGQIFKLVDWRFWRHDGQAPALRRPDGCTLEPAVILPAQFDELIISVDCTFKKTIGADRVGLQGWGSLGGDRFLLARATAQRTFTETKRAIVVMAMELARYGFVSGMSRVLIEDTANGPAVIEDMQHDFPGLIPVKPEGGKESRANAVTAQHESHNVYIPEPEHEEWVGDYLVEMTDFPRGDHDDDVDATTQALANMRSDFAALLAAMVRNR